MWYSVICKILLSASRLVHELSSIETWLTVSWFVGELSYKPCITFTEVVAPHYIRILKLLVPAVAIYNIPHCCLIFNSAVYCRVVCFWCGEAMKRLGEQGWTCQITGHWCFRASVHNRCRPSEVLYSAAYRNMDSKHLKQMSCRRRSVYLSKFLC